MQTDHYLLSGAEEERPVLKQTFLILLKEKEGKKLLHELCYASKKIDIHVCIYTHIFSFLLCEYIEKKVLKKDSCPDLCKT